MEVDLDLQRIIEGCMTDDRRSQYELYRKYYSFGMGVAVRYAKDDSEASEILNEGFFKIFNNLKSYDSAQPFEPWMKRILVNVFIDIYRKRKRRFLPLEEMNVEPVYHVPDAVSNLSYHDLLDCVRKLPPQYQLVFNLYVLDGFKHHEIAEKLNISVGTSKSNLARAKEKLKLIVIAHR